MGCSGVKNCFGKRVKQLAKKIVVVFIIQFVGWFIYTYIEEGFWLTDCIFDHENIKRATALNTNDTTAKTVLHHQLSEILKVNVSEEIFSAYHDDFKDYFEVKDVTPKPVQINEICLRWYLFTAITLTTVGYGNVVPKTIPGKIVFFPYCLIGIPTMLFFLGYIGQLLAELCSKIVELLSCKRSHDDAGKIKHKELKSFLVIFMFLWVFILLEAAATHYLPPPSDRLSFIDGVYFYFVSFTTIGYGDITKPMEQPAFEFRLYFGLCLMSGVVNSALDFYQKFSEENEQRRRRKCCCLRHRGTLDIEPATEMVVVNSNCSREEFDERWKAKSNYGFADEK